MAKRVLRRSISLPPEMGAMLAQIAARQDRRITTNDLIRDAVRQYIDQQAQSIGSRRYFQKTLQGRLDALEVALTFQLQVLTYLVASLFDETADVAITEAIIQARQHGQTLQAQISAVRELEDEP